VYGSRAETILDTARKEPALAREIDPHTGAIAAEIVFAFKTELASTLGDALLRRTMIGLGPDLGRGSLNAVLEVCKASLGWDEGRALGERAEYLDYISRFNPRAAPS